MDFSEKIDSYKQTIEKAKSAKVKAETTLEQVSKQQEEIKEQLKELDVTPETAEAKIQEITESLTKLVEEGDVIQNEIKEALI